MSSEPVLALLERHRDHIQGDTVFVGLPGSVAGAGEGGSPRVLTTDFGEWQRHGGHERGWYFGYDDPALPEAFDQVIVGMPKSKSELSMRLAWALSRLRSGGELWLAGAKREGIAGGARQLQERFPEAWKADSARHCQLWKAVVESDAIGSAFRVLDWLEELDVSVAGQSLRLASMPGLFSEGRVDAGTQRLLETIASAPQGPVLDFACGSGIVTAWLLAQWPELDVTLCDVQWQALACARWLFRDQPNVRVVSSDGLADVHSRFATIVTNPPFHKGIATDASVTETLIRQAPGHLAPGGELRLVANTFLPYLQVLKRCFAQTEIVSDGDDFRVYRSVAGRHSPKKW